MRIGPIISAMLRVEDLDAALRPWPGAERGQLARERAMAIGALSLAGAPCAVVGRARAITLVECKAAPAAGGWIDVRLDANDAPTTASLGCERPRLALGWYRGLGLIGRAIERTDGAVKAELPGGHALKLLPIEAAGESRQKPLLVSFSRIGADGERVHGLSPRILAGPAGELIELL